VESFIFFAKSSFWQIYTTYKIGSKRHSKFLLIVKHDDILLAHYPIGYVWDNAGRLTATKSLHRVWKVRSYRRSVNTNGCITHRSGQLTRIERTPCGGSCTIFIQATVDQACTFGCKYENKNVTGCRTATRTSNETFQLQGVRTQYTRICPRLPFGTTTIPDELTW
jgi:hypothetical protein